MNSPPLSLSKPRMGKGRRDSTCRVASMTPAAPRFQTARLAAYLEAGLLASQEDEPLTARATRSALDEINANPQRLLN